MNHYSNKQLPKSISVFLLLSGVLFFAFQFFQIGEIEYLLCNEFEYVSTNEVTTWNGVRFSDDQPMLFSSNELPIFKNRKAENVSSNLEVDFPSSANLPNVLSRKMTTASEVDELENQTSVTNYNSTQNKSSTTYSTRIQNISANTSTFQTNKTDFPINSGIQSIANFGTNSPTFSNTSTNAFLANNTLSITTDMSENNHPMLVDGEGNPGDPGVPVGEGSWVLLSLLVGYGVLKNKKRVLSEN